MHSHRQYVHGIQSVLTGTCREGPRIRKGAAVLHLRTGHGRDALPGDSRPHEARCRRFGERGPARLQGSRGTQELHLSGKSVHVPPIDPKVLDEQVACTAVQRPWMPAVQFQSGRRPGKAREQFRRCSADLLVHDRVAVGDQHQLRSIDPARVHHQFATDRAIERDHQGFVLIQIVREWPQRPRGVDAVISPPPDLRSSLWDQLHGQPALHHHGPGTARFGDGQVGMNAPCAHHQQQQGDDRRDQPGPAFHSSLSNNWSRRAISSVRALRSPCTNARSDPALQVSTASVTRPSSASQVASW